MMKNIFIPPFSDRHRASSAVRGLFIGASLERVFAINAQQGKPKKISHAGRVNKDATVLR
jgi:hypothetical protein